MKWQRLRVLGLGLGVGAAIATGCQTPRENPGPSFPSSSTQKAALPARVPFGGKVPAAQDEQPIRTVAAQGPADPDQVPTAYEQSSLPPTEGTLDLAIALRLAGVDNPTITLAREVVREALAEQLGARSLLLPSINVGGNYRRHTGTLLAAQGFVRTVNFDSLYLGAGAGVLGSGTAAIPGVRLFAHLGDAAYEPLAARQRVNVRRSEASAVQNAVLLNVATRYLELMGAEARLAILRKGETDLAEVVRLTVAHAKTGQGRKADADRAEANMELLRNDLRSAEAEVTVASTRLSQLLNLDTSVQLRTPGGSVHPIRLVSEDADAEALTEEALRARPEVFARSAAISEAQTRVRQEKARPWLPTVSVGYSTGGFGGNVTSADFGNLRGRSEFDATAVWTVQNLGFGNRARVRAADANVGSAIAAYDLVINQIRREVTEALAATRAAAEQIKTAEVALAAAEEGFALEMERIKQGQWRPIEVLDSFRQLLDSRQELVRAAITYNIAQFRLFAALGNTP
jgi:outer membrane protein TolC